jgi:hypothetical protein
MWLSSHTELDIVSQWSFMEARQLECLCISGLNSRMSYEKMDNVIKQLGTAPQLHTLLLSRIDNKLT